MIMVQKKNVCIACGGKHLAQYLDLGKSTLANAFLKKTELKKPEVKFPLRVSYCRDCHLAQLTDIVDRKALFENYAYFSSTSPQLHEYFRNYAEKVIHKFPKQTKQLILEIASNDGLLLKYFQKSGAKVLGIDPAKNIARVARKNGIETIANFFSLELAKKVVKKYGHAGVVLANNVLAHSDNIHGIVSGVKEVLDPRGVFVFEVQYLADLLKKGEFDNTYHEHVCYFSVAPLIKLMEKCGLQIFDIEHVDGQGGSIRVYAGHTLLVFPINSSVKKFIAKEKKHGLYEFKTYKNFNAIPKKIKENLSKLLRRLKKQNKKIIGYGASAKGNTLLQYCNIGHETVDYIVDNAPSKQGKYTPGTHIPIVAPQHLKRELPDYVLLLAWNFADSIMKNESWLRDKGAKFIKPIPKVKVL